MVYMVYRSDICITIYCRPPVNSRFPNYKIAFTMRIVIVYTSSSFLLSRFLFRSESKFNYCSIYVYRCKVSIHKNKFKISLDRLVTQMGIRE